MPLRDTIESKPTEKWGSFYFLLITWVNNSSICKLLEDVLLFYYIG